ncbi:MAG: hypothetical protein ABIZ56_04260 [Chthoniobacteraceae bacterium]
MVIAILCSHEAGEVDTATQVAVILANDATYSERSIGTNVWDLAGEPALVNEDGSVIESRSGAKIIRCLECLIDALPRGSRDEKPLNDLLERYRAREVAMTTTKLPALPPSKAWWKFW